jgi:hypothetical protein
MSVAGWMILLLLSLAVWTAGLTGWLIFGPLTYRHLQDRDQHHGKGGWFFSPTFFCWVLMLGWCMLVGGVASVIALVSRPGQAPW